MRSSLAATVCMLGLVALTACDWSAQQGSQTPTPIGASSPVVQVAPGTTATPTEVSINITREQYMQALQTWRSQGVQEYEARVEYWAYSEFMGIWTLRVQVTGADAQVIDYTREPGLDAPVGGVGSQALMPTTEDGKKYVREQLKSITVEGQFDSILEDLNGRGQGLWTTSVTFDAKTGNPTYVDSNPTPYSTEPSSWTLHSLRILKQTKPQATPSS